MAGFFYLGGRLVEEGPGPVPQPPQQPPPPQGSASSSKQEEEEEEAADREDQEIRAHNLFLYRNQEIYNNNNNHNSNKGSLEIWPAQYNHLQLQAQNLNINTNYLSFGVGPSRVSDDSSAAIMRPQLLGGSGHGLGSVGGGATNCQDCGNQAKKDCPHLRCRTCCKSRGLPCQTHVKSTWVPAAKRRERQQQQQPQQNQPQQQEQQLFINSNPKRPRENQLATTAASSSHHYRDLAASHTDRLPSSTSGLELAQFPAEVSSPAVFRCVKVSSMDDADEEFAYQTAVNIGGHVFKGILYDQGPDHRNYTSPTGESALGRGNVIAGATNTTTAMTNTNPPGVTLLQVDHSSLYPAPLNAFMAGTQFFPPSRS